MTSELAQSHRIKSNLYTKFSPNHYSIMKLFQPFLLLLLFLISGKAFSQEDFNSYKNVELKSPNVAALNKYGDIPVSYHTGVPNISIPIYTIQEGPLQLPISLSYHASGLRVEEVASWVGAGWSLLAGGSISRQVKGLPDENNNGPVMQEKGYFSDYGINSYVWNYIDSINVPRSNMAQLSEQLLDGEPDLFSFNIGAYSGKFVFNDDRTPVLITGQDIKIEVGYVAGRNQDQGFTKWVLTTPDGVRYHFGENGIRETSAPYSVANGSTFNQPFTSWHLTKIESADKKWQIVFNYVREKYSSYATSSKGLMLHFFATDPGSDEVEIMKNSVDGWRLSTIQFSNHTVTFVPGADRQDLAAYDLWSSTENVNQGLEAAKTLGRIEVKNSTNTFHKAFDFYYSYFDDQTSSLSTTINNWNVNTDRKRLKLDKIQERSFDNSVVLPPFVFEYYDPQLVPRRLSLSRDHWGYNNGIKANNRLIPSFSVGYDDYVGADRDARFPAMQAGTLKKIQYPTGGYTQFDYQPHNTWVQYTQDELGPKVRNDLSVGYDGGTKSAEYTHYLNKGLYKVQITVSSCATTSSYHLRRASDGRLFTVSMEAGQTGSKFIDVPTAGNYALYMTTGSSLTGCGAMGAIYTTLTKSYNENVTVGGLRVSKITSHDGGIASAAVSQTFEYESSGISNGILFGRPTYISIIRNDRLRDYGEREESTWTLYSSYNEYGCLGYWLSAADKESEPVYVSPNSLHTMSETQGNHIGYSFVKVTNADGGYSTYAYETFRNGDYLRKDVAIRRIPNRICSNDIPNYPPAPLPHNYYRGTLKEEQHFTASAQILQKTISNQVYEQTTIKVPALIAVVHKGSSQRHIFTN